MKRVYYTIKDVDDRIKELEREIELGKERGVTHSHMCDFDEITLNSGIKLLRKDLPDPNPLLKERDYLKKYKNLICVDRWIWWLGSATTLFSIIYSLRISL